jgi:hypothetical protein
MKIIRQFPPLYAEINRRFNVRGKPVIFTFGETIYNPNNVKIGPELMAHEEVHRLRQTDDQDRITEWWLRYIDDWEFRLVEELPAHQAEFAECAKTYDGRALERMLHRIADRLSSPLYGSLIDYADARRRIGGS